MEKKPVYCAHPNKTSAEGNDCYRYDCPLCGARWYSHDDEPKREIGYIEAGMVCSCICLGAR